MFKDGRESVESDPCSGRPATRRTPENVERVRAIINRDRQLAVQELEADVGTLKTTVPKILTQDLDMKHVAKFTTQLLLTEHQEHHAAVANDLIQTVTNDPDFLRKVITRDESWVYGYDLKTKDQSSTQVSWFSTPEEGTAVTARSKPC